MGDIRFEHLTQAFRAMQAAGNPAAFLASTPLPGLVELLASKSLGSDDYARNVIATALMNRLEERPSHALTALEAVAPAPYLLLTPELKIVDATQAYLDATGTRLRDIRREAIFDVFPDPPADPTGEVPPPTGVRKLTASFERVLDDEREDQMRRIRYDIPGSCGADRFDERYWEPANFPVLGRDGSVEYIVHRAMDVTSEYRGNGWLQSTLI